MPTDLQEGAIGPAKLDRVDALITLAIFLLVFIVRYLTRGALYFVDGPRIVEAIRSHRYVVQPPGYWLFAHMGGLFRDPVFGLSFFNEMCSAAGGSVFYLLGRKFGFSKKFATLAAFTYSSIFFVWFSSEVHSSYASQILFAPLIVYFFLLYKQRPSVIGVVLCGTSYAIGTGLRPSDGAFLGFLFGYMALCFVSRWKHRWVLFAVTGVVCLAWYIPTRIALSESQKVGLGNQLGSLAYQVSPLLTGINAHSMANILRVLLPLLAAFGILIPAIFLRRSCVENRLLALWVVPGLTFFLLMYMADPTYLTYLAGAIVLMAALSRNRQVAAVLLTLCMACNVLLFLGARPLEGSSRVDAAINFYVVKYTNYGIRHQWSSTYGAAVRQRVQ